MGGDIVNLSLFTKGLIGIPVFLLLLFVALTLHELGHYIAARFFGMPIKSVVIGRGKMLFKWQNKNDTNWIVNIVPFGAFVHLYGERDDMEGEFYKRPFYQRFITICAGPLINFTIIPFLFLGFYVLQGIPSTPPVVTAIEKGQAAEAQGLLIGDRFLKANGTPVYSFQDMWRIAYPKGPVQGIYTIKRGGEIIEKPFTPGWTEYRDTDGIDRKNARFGVIWQHAPFKLSAILKINDQAYEGEDALRAALLDIMDQNALLTIKGPDDQPRYFHVHLNGDVNANLNDPNHKDYDRVYLGVLKGNQYVNLTFREYVIRAFIKSAELIKNIATLPFQLLPVDKQRIQDAGAVSGEQTWLANKIYGGLHLFAVISVFIGFINLLPLPHLDGGHILIQTTERIIKKPLHRKHRAKIFAAAFFIFYMSVLFSNLDNMPRYIDSRVKKVQELIDQENQ